MSLQFPAELPAEHSLTLTGRAVAQLSHGELLLGKVTRVTPDGIASIKFSNIEARTHGRDLLQPGQRVFARVQRTRDETLLSLLPNIKEGDIISGIAGERYGSGILARFDESDLAVRLASSKAPPPQKGTHIQAQFQGLAGRPILQLLPKKAETDILNGLVVANREDGTVVLDAEGTTLIAASPVSVETGVLLTAKVIRAGDKWILQILHSSSSAEEITLETGTTGKIEPTLARFLTEPQYSRLLDALVSGDIKIDGITRGLSQLLQQFADGGERPAWILTLTRALEAILLSPSEANLAEQLSNAIENSGIGLESRLLQAALRGSLDTEQIRDLQLALLIASQKLSNLQQPAGSDGENISLYYNKISAKVAQLLDAITSEQFHNLRTVPSNEIYIQLPLTDTSGLEHFEIRISHQGRRPTRKLDLKNVLLTMAVTTTNLGRIKATVAINKGQVSCYFRTDRESVAELIMNNTDTLRKGLERLDYRVAYIDCSLSSEERELTIAGDPPAVPEKGLDLRI